MHLPVYWNMVYQYQIVAFALILGAAAAITTLEAHSSRGTLLSQKRKISQADEPADDEAKGPADSKVIDGPDCGNVKQIFSKWNKAKNVGSAAGQAQAAISAADHMATVAQQQVDRAKEIGNELSKDGAMPKGIELALEPAETAISDVSSASSELDTKLSTVKDQMNAGDISGDSVKAADLKDLKEKTEAATVATKKAKDNAERLMEKAEEAKAYQATSTTAPAAPAGAA